jgi:hypothetical protein
MTTAPSATSNMATKSLLRSGIWWVLGNFMRLWID